MRSTRGLFATKRSGWLERFAFDFHFPIFLFGLFTEQFAGVPVDLVAHHRKSDHADLAGQRDAGLLAPRLAAAGDSIERLFAPLVVLKAAPSTLQQKGAEELAASLADASVAVDLTGLMLLGCQPEITRKMSCVLESMRIVDGCDDHFGGLAADTRNRHQPNDVRMLGGELTELRFKRFKLGG